jgi:uncharacterized protein
MGTQNTGKKTALVTGASSGIGLELARCLARDGYDLVLVSRSKADLEKIGQEFATAFGIRATSIEKDLMEPMAAEELYDEVKSSGIEIDVLVNDAGQGIWGRFTETDLREELDIIQLNICSLVVLTKKFLRDMVARGSGRILQLASVVSKAPSPFLTVYAGTKAFVYNFTLGVINELKDTPGVTMTALLPGATDTDFFHKAGSDHTKVYVETELSDPADVAKDGYEALMAGESKVISGGKNKVQNAMGNFISDEMVAEQGRKQNEPSTKDPRS